jgi:site-specific DNA-methyltransferase (adenine-specific)
MPRTTILVGDCRLLLRDLADNSLDSIVTDPPYELGFMGKGWDNTGVAYDKTLWLQALRVLKPGGHLLAFGGTRTYHRMACAIEDAGFEIRDQIQWIYGSGFPKSHNLEADWKGWGTALKPANEPICMARKPLSEDTVETNVLRWGTGAINVDGCRVGFSSPQDQASAFPGGKVTSHGAGSLAGPGSAQDVDRLEFDAERNLKGRWPANLVHDGSPEVLDTFPEASGAKADVSPDAPSPKTSGIYNKMNREGEASKNRRYSDKGGTSFTLTPGARRFDTGSAARFFYCAKADRTDRNEGLDGLEKKPLFWSSGTKSPGTFQAEGTDKSSENNHPTVKPVDLMRWLVRLVTPPAGQVLDPFMGSGSTGKACAMEGFDFVGMELSPEYAKIAEGRIIHVAPTGSEIVVSESAADLPKAPVREVGGQIGLFDGQQ